MNLHEIVESSRLDNYQSSKKARDELASYKPERKDSIMQKASEKTFKR
jgi:hypothetical protein